MVTYKLKPNNGSIKKKKRLGRGIGSGKGRTCGRGNKGQKSRSGYSKKIGFEGGQTPFYKRIPKFGFKTKKKKYSILNLNRIQNIINKYNIINNIIDKKLLTKLKIIKKNKKLKILSNGRLDSKIIIYADKFSKKAYNKILNNGSKIKKI
ncbi:MAG: 50S ribosomal protein L15 [Candidatus Shikimatogenerans bostrichidophilus]|nr:MAG: 50S ribosomal protein L15 [Candidatus Shikimatogenerans bostrichidophilus]